MSVKLLVALVLVEIKSRMAKSNEYFIIFIIKVLNANL